MTNYYYEWEGDTVYRSEKGIVFAKSKGKNEVKVSFEHPGFVRAYMHGDKISKQQYDDF